jgi:hypothetical protein
MGLQAKQLIIAILSVAIVIVLGYVIFTEKEHQMAEREIVVKSDDAGCIKCHKSEFEGGPGRDPGIVMHWEASVHAEQGIGCTDCHGVPEAGSGEDILNPRYVVASSWNKGSGLKSVELAMADGAPVERTDLWMHEGAEIVINVSPRTCARCHEKEAREFFDSRHSSASQFIGSVDNFLGRFAEGPAAANNGCQQCHGSVVRLASGGGDEQAPIYAPDAWPNTGIGRVNMDGSWGSCTACHSRHEFSAEVGRRPDNCGKCHMGPDHPQVEIFYESKHGVAYRKNERDMKLDLPGGEWVLGRDYAQAPTCSSCHMGPVAPHANYPGLELTHDVGSRISWTLRPKISIKPDGITAEDGTVILKDPEGRRADMQQACMTCHSDNWVENFYIQYDQAVELYNNKYARPLVAIYEFLKSEKIIDAIPMNEEMDYLFFEIWHHEGRRARHGASMMGPDYVQWHGFYELSRNFYTHFVPLAVELGEKVGKGHKVESFIAKTLRGPDGEDWEKFHRWTEGLSPEQREAMLSWEQETYHGMR